MLGKIQKSYDLLVDRKKQPYYNSARSAPGEKLGRYLDNHRYNNGETYPQLPRKSALGRKARVLAGKMNAEYLVK
jgi:hypothetical protein